MERVVERSNVRRAYQRGVENKGAPGVDGVTVAEFNDWLKVHWPSVKAGAVGRQLSAAAGASSGHPSKPCGGVRTGCAGGGRID